MKTRMQICGWFLAALVPFGTVAQATTLSVNFVGGTAGDAVVTGIAGSIQAPNWNNAAGAAGSLPLAINDAGAVAASVTWAANSTYAAYPGGNPGGGGDADMMSGYLDNFGDNGDTITVTGLGPAFTANGYEVRVYFNADSSGTQGFSVTDNLLNTDFAYGNQAGGAGTNYPLGGPNGYIGSTQTASNTAFPANYVLLTGFTGSSFTLTGLYGTLGDGRSRPNGFQVFSPTVPEPSTLALLGLGVVGMAVRSRRRRAGA